MELNVDVVDNETGEIYLEGVTLKAARNFITKEMGKIVRDEVDNIDLDDIDGGDQMEVRSIYVDFPEETRKRDLSVNAREFWQYENGGGQVSS
jgi:ribosomal protein S6E (S10)